MRGRLVTNGIGDSSAGCDLSLNYVQAAIWWCSGLTLRPTAWQQVCKPTPMVSILKRSLQQPSALALAFSANRLARALSGTGSNARPSNPVCRKLGSTAAAAMSSTTVPHADLVEALRAVVPKLDSKFSLAPYRLFHVRAFRSWPLSA